MAGFIILWAAALLSTFYQTSGPVQAGVLRPELGTYLETVGKFNPTTEEIYATVVVPIPKLPPGTYEIETLNCSDIMPIRDHWYGVQYSAQPNKLYQRNVIMTSISLCRDYNTAIMGLSEVILRYQNNINIKMDNLNDILAAGDTIQDQEKELSKRPKRFLFALPFLPLLFAARTVGTMTLAAVQYKRFQNLKNTVNQIKSKQTKGILCFDLFPSL
jgi:hypothetical protein